MKAEIKTVMKLPPLWRPTQAAVRPISCLRHRTNLLARGSSSQEACLSHLWSICPSSKSVRKFSTGRRSISDTAGEHSDFLERFINSQESPRAALDHFNSSQWTRSYLQDPRYEPIPFFSRQLNPKTGENFFFAQTINTPTTIPHVLAMRSNALRPLVANSCSAESNAAKASIKPSIQIYKNPTTQLSSTAPDTAEVLIFLHLGTGLNAHPSIAHGGVVCVIFDEAFRLLVLLHQNVTAGLRTGPRDQHFTVQFNTSYRVPLITPADVLVKCWLMKKEGRKWFMKAQIVGEIGVMLTEAESVWVTATRKEDG